MSEVLFPHPTAETLPGELVLPLAGATLRGTSIAARATAFAVPEFGVALDVGRMSPTIAAQPVLLLSHAHLDHLAGVLAYLNVRARFYSGEPTSLVVPEPVAARLKQALALLPGMESVHKRLDLEAAIRAVAPGGTVVVPGGTATAFAADHGVPTVGWTLRRDGESRAALVYAADGSTEPFRADPALLDAGAAVVECSFVEANRRVAARLAKHAHLKDWIELAPRLACDTLVLAHLPEIGPGEASALLAPLARAFPGRLVAWLPRE